MEAVYGREHSEMLAKLTREGLFQEEAEIFAERPADTKLRLALEGRNPDDGLTVIAYDKGYFFLWLIEETVGREKFDVFVKNYFAEHAFQVMDTDRFLSYLRANLLDEETEKIVNIAAWVDGERIPDNIPVVASDRMMKVDELVEKWATGSVPTSEIPWNNWVYQEQYHFLSNMSESVSAAQMQALDSAFHITKTGNNEVLFAWLEKSIEKGYNPAFSRLDSFLVSVGRRKFLTPLYKAMLEKNQQAMALDIYKRARPNYHAVAVMTMDELLGVN